jgi:hypothetical protein
MNSAKTEFIAWLRKPCVDGERILLADLERAALVLQVILDHKMFGCSGEVDRWSDWLSLLVAGLRRRLRHPDHLIDHVEKHSSPDVSLKFRIEHWRVAGEVYGIGTLALRSVYEW